MTIPKEAVSYHGLYFEPRAPIEGTEKVLFSFDESLADLKKRGYQRHPSPREVFSFLADGLENKLTAEQKRIYDDMLRSYGEWMDMAEERKGNTLILYSGIDGLVWNPAQEVYVPQNFRCAEKKEFNIAGKKSQEWINLQKFDDAFVQHVYGRSFAQLPQEMRDGNQRAQVLLPAEGKLWPVGRGIDLWFFVGIVSWASRGVALGNRPQGAHQK